MQLVRHMRQGAAMLGLNETKILLTLYDYVHIIMILPAAIPSSAVGATR